MHINKSLNLVIPVETDDHGTLYFHSTPISRDVFERYFLIISKVFAALFAEGLNVIAGPRIAYLMLKELAEKAGKLEDVQNGLLNEIHRLTNVSMLIDDGWQSVPYQTIIERKILDADILMEVENAIVFFICVSAMHKREVLTGTIEAMTGLFGWQYSSLNCTEYTASLTTLIEAATSQPQATTSLVAH